MVRAHGAAKEAGLKLIVGAEITPEDAPPLVLWATDRAAYGRLARLITQGRRRAEKGECRLRLDGRCRARRGTAGGDRLQIAECRLQSRRLASHDLDQPAICNLQLATLNLQSCTPTATSSPTAATCWPSCTAGRTTGGSWSDCGKSARQTRIPLVAAGDVHYHVPERAALHDVLTAIRCGCDGGRGDASTCSPTPSGT